jgi:hypothetical protein
VEWGKDLATQERGTRARESHTFELDVSVDDLHVMQIGYCADQLGKYAAHDVRGQHLAVAGSNLKQVSAWAVAEHQDGSRGLDVPGLEIYQ